MWIRRITLSLALGASLIGAPVLAGIHAPEEAIEGSTQGLELPRAVGGALMVAPCSGCKLLTVRLDANTQFFLGKRPVTLTEFNKFVESSGPRGLTIMYDRKTSAITRMVVRMPRSSATGAQSQ
jgi:hypothetical protein